MDLDLVAISGLVGLVLPFLISFVKNIGRTWPTQVTRTVAFGIALTAAVVTVGANEGWAFDSFNTFVQSAIASFTAIYAVAMVSYQNLWKGTGPEQGLAAAFANNNS